MKSYWRMRRDDLRADLRRLCEEHGIERVVRELEFEADRLSQKGRVEELRPWHGRIAEQLHEARRRLGWVSEEEIEKGLSSGAGGAEKDGMAGGSPPPTA